MSKYLHLFEGYGLEIEYMIVDQDTLNVRPVADEVLRAAAGELTSDYEDGFISWSNELTLHLIELKTTEPAPSLSGTDREFHRSLSKINDLLKKQNAVLMPTAMHPWMNPLKETKLWPHDNNEIYEAYNRIFNCQGHGWSNLQSVHINLPFANDEEFGRLHAAIRLILPILPALTASSPFQEGKATGYLDTRLAHYSGNQKRIPAISGTLIPEAVFTIEDYQNKILKRIYQEISPHDPQEMLQEDWLNSRGAIARFGRQTIEIRILDVQECPKADLAVLSVIVALLKNLVAEKWVSYDEQKKWSEISLRRIYDQVVIEGENAQITEPDYLDLWSMKASSKTTVRDLWKHLLNRMIQHGPEISPDSLSCLNVILEKGPLARRLLTAFSPELARSPQPSDVNQDKLREIYREPTRCLQNNSMFHPN